jgi:hypothetical protein
MTFWLYFSLAAEIIGIVGQVQMMLKTPGPITGPQLSGLILPVLQTLNAINPQVNVPTDLVMKICDAVAATINQFYGRKAA